MYLDGCRVIQPQALVDLIIGLDDTFYLEGNSVGNLLVLKEDNNKDLYMVGYIDLNHEVIEWDDDEED